MTTPTIEQQEALKRAHAEGKKIQFRVKIGFENTSNWHSADDPTWNFGAIEYRIAPEPFQPEGHSKPFTPDDVGARVYSHKWGIGTIESYARDLRPFPVIVRFDQDQGITRSFRTDGNYFKKGKEGVDERRIKRVSEEPAAEEDEGLDPITLDDVTPYELSMCIFSANKDRVTAEDERALADREHPRNRNTTSAEHIAALRTGSHQGQWYVTTVEDEARIYRKSGNNYTYDKLILAQPLTEEAKALETFIVQAHNTMPAILDRLNQADRMQTALLELLNVIGHNETGFTIEQDCFDAYQAAQDAHTEAEQWCVPSKVEDEG
jgi:hypothetical protein